MREGCESGESRVRAVATGMWGSSGSHLCEGLVPGGAAVVALDNSTTTVASNPERLGTVWTSASCLSMFRLALWRILGARRDFGRCLRPLGGRGRHYLGFPSNRATAFSATSGSSSRTSIRYTPECW